MIWDRGFFWGLLVATFAQGVIPGNSIQGFPANRQVAGTSWDRFSPLPRLTGVAKVKLCPAQRPRSTRLPTLHSKNVLALTVFTGDNLVHHVIGHGAAGALAVTAARKAHYGL
jgi:hypothetical protein